MRAARKSGEDLLRQRTRSPLIHMRMAIAWTRNSHRGRVVVQLLHHALFFILWPSRRNIIFLRPLLFLVRQLASHSSNLPPTEREQFVHTLETEMRRALMPYISSCLLLTTLRALSPHLPPKTGLNGKRDPRSLARGIPVHLTPP